MQKIAEDKELEADLKITQEGMSKCTFKRNFVYFAQNRQIILFFMTLVCIFFVSLQQI